MSISGSGSRMTLTCSRCSISAIAARFSLSRNVATGTGSTARIWALRSFIASSSIKRSTDSDRERTSRMVPCPLQRGHTTPLVSPREGRRRWRDISIKPKREIRPIWTRARSSLSASRIRFSTSRWLRAGDISIKSITTRPPLSRRRS